MNILQFKTRGDLTAEANSVEFVEHYRHLVGSLPFVSSFDDNSWDLRGFCQSASHGNSKLTIRFTKYGTSRVERSPEWMAQPFRDFAKAWILHQMASERPLSFAAYKRDVAVLRQVEVSLNCDSPGSPTICNLTPDNCMSINAAIKGAKRETYQQCKRFNTIVAELGDEGYVTKDGKLKPGLSLLSKNFRWKGHTKPPFDGYRSATGSGKEYVKAKLPSTEAISAVAYLFYNAEEITHRWTASLAAILCAQPSRIGELLWQTVNCEIESERQGRQVYSLRWWPEKGGNPAIKDFIVGSDPWVPVLREAIEFLRNFSLPAREMARWYEKNPGKLFLPKELEHLRAKSTITVAETASILQYTQTSVVFQYAKRHKIPISIDPITGLNVIYFGDLEQNIIKKLPFGFPFVDPMTKRRRYHHLLCLTRQWEPGDRTQPSLTMIRKPTLEAFQRRLNEALAAFNLVEADGSPIQFNTHQFRHRWEDSARKAGIDEVWRNARAGRARASHAEAYENRDPVDRAEGVRAKLRLEEKGILFGELLAFTPKRPLYLKEVEELVETYGRRKAIVVTIYGVCANNFSLSPCNMFLDCIHCKQHICIKGLPGKTEFIRRAMAQQEASLASARAAAADGDYGVESHIKETLEPSLMVLRGILAVMDDPKYPVGTQVMVAQDGRNDPIAKSMRLRIDYEKEMGRDVELLEATLLQVVMQGSFSPASLME